MIKRKTNNIIVAIVKDATFCPSHMISILIIQISSINPKAKMTISVIDTISA